MSLNALITNYKKPFNLMENLTNLKLWVLSGLFTGVYTFFVKYLYSDVTFLKWFLVVFLLDLITGTTKSIVQKQMVTSYLLRRTCLKGVQYFSFLILSHALVNFTVEGQQYIELSWLPKLCATYAILIEAKSVYENIEVINPGIKTAWIVRKLNSLLKSTSQVPKDNNNTNLPNKQ